MKKPTEKVRNMFKVNNKDTRPTSMKSLWCLIFSIKHISHLVLVFLSFSLNKLMFAGLADLLMHISRFEREWIKILVGKFLFVKLGHFYKSHHFLGVLLFLKKTTQFLSSFFYFSLPPLFHQLHSMWRLQLHVDFKISIRF